MLISMTGYGRGEQLIDGRNILCEIRSVNHRYFEYSARVPRAYGYLEEKGKSYLQKVMTRGKVELSISINHVSGTDAIVSVNPELAKGYADALRSLCEPLDVQDDLKLSDFVRFSDIFTLQKATEDADEIWKAVEQVLAQAAENFLSMRKAEGERMEADIAGRLDTIEAYVGKIENYTPSIIERYRERLRAKIAEVLENKDIDEQRVLTEVAILTDKLAVDEETVRLHSHLAQFRKLIASGEAVGRKLDFLIQEINREMNTLGSKIQDVVVTGYVVEMKAELEKIREQIQNVE